MTPPLWYQLRNAVALRQFDAAGTMLKAYPELRVQRNRVGETVLHFMAVENDIVAVRWLHQHGFVLDTVNDFGQPVVFEVAQLGHEQLLLWFARAGADFGIIDGDGQDIVAFLREVLREDMLAFLQAHQAEIGLPAAACATPAAHGRPRVSA